MKHKISQVISVLLCVAMLIGLVPATAFATGNHKADFTNSHLSLVTDKASALAPGVTQDLYTVYDKKGDQVKMFVTTADMNVDTVELFASYKDMDPTDYGMSKLTEQVASFNEKVAAGDEYYKGTVVAGINASYYNMVNGKPYGTFVMNGIDVTTESEGNSLGYFAVMKDGSVKIGRPGDYSSDKGNIQEAISIQQMLIVDGNIVSGLDSAKKYPRQTIGITADNQVIVMTADGNNAPTSIGLTIQEQAEVMLDLGCVWAGHLDGGGSATYACKQEGSDDFVITNRPADGSERSISNGFLIVSTEATSYEFDHVVFETENEYLTPGTSVEVVTTGVSSSGNAADIPTDITYETTNGTFVNGVFTAGSEVGMSTIIAKYAGKEVGSYSLNVVLPDTVSFRSDIITVPYGKTVKLDLVACYGINEIKVKANDFNFVFADQRVGTINNFDFTACEENEAVTGTTLTVSLKANASIIANATIVLGKGSEVIRDFESGTLPNWTFETGYPQYGPKGSAKDENGNYYYNGQNEVGSIEIVSKDNGQVKNGEYALALNCDYTQIYETGYHVLNLSGLNLQVPAKATAFGMWLYLPELEDVSGLKCCFYGQKEGSTAYELLPYFINEGSSLLFEHNGWYYFSVDMSKFDAYTVAVLQIYITDRDNSNNNYYFKDHASVNSKFTLYIDDITVDYSSAIDDRNAPTFSEVKVGYEGVSDAVEMKGQTINKNIVAASVKATDDNAGLDLSTAKVYVDGVEINSNVTVTAAGVIVAEDITLADGVHTFKFEVKDNMGNAAYIKRQICVDADSDLPTISIVPKNANANKILIGSLYWVDLVATNAKDVNEATVTFNLNSVSQWELEHMIVSPGFKGTYTIDKILNNATITIQRGSGEITESNVLAQIPIRTWESRLTEYTGYEEQTPTTLWSRKIIWPMDIKLSADYGKVTFVDGTMGSFSMEPIAVITELYGNYGELHANGDYANKTSWHIHTAIELEDKAATCIENGYTGRTFCEVCNSVVDWGTTIEATGHKYDFADGVLKCSCGKLFNGQYEDGKTYVDGVAIGNGWLGDSYYLNGKKLTGIQSVEGYYYNFGDDGVCVGQVKYTGCFEMDGKTYYSKLGVLESGWFQVGEDWYYFLPGTKEGAQGAVQTTDGVTFTFENGKVLDGTWVTKDQYKMYWYGPSYYKNVALNVRYLEVIIDGALYLFDASGRMQTGIILTHKSGNSLSICYDCGTDGKAIGYNGALNDMFYKDGVQQKAYQLVSYNGDFYFIGDGHKIVMNREMYLGSSVEGHTYSDGTPLQSGKYEFGPDGKMIIKDGVIGDYLYINNVKQTAYQLVKYNGDFYFINDGNKVVKNREIYLTSELLAGHTYTDGTQLQRGTYEFDSEGKMIIKDGVVGDYLYINNVKQTAYQLVKYKGDFYFINDGHKIVKNREIYLGSSHLEGYTYANGEPLKPGMYEFDSEGKMIIKDGVVGDYLYINNVKQTAYKLVKHNGDFYFINDGHKVVKNREIYLGSSYVEGYTDADGNPLKPGMYEFDANGKMIIK